MGIVSIQGYFFLFNRETFVFDKTTFYFIKRGRVLIESTDNEKIIVGNYFLFGLSVLKKFYVSFQPRSKNVIQKLD